MPLYDYRCPTGHVTEALRGIECRVTPCDVCDREAERVPFNHVAIQRLDVIEIDGAHINQARMLSRNGRVNVEDVQTREKFSLFQEATQERDYAYAKAEANLGQTIQGPDLWSRAKEGAKQMIAAGAAPLPANTK